jgi:hypothetical protein
MRIMSLAVSSESGQGRVWPTYVGLALVIVAAIVIRTWDLEGDSITHPEAYAPGIEYPTFSSQPIERTSVDAIIRSSLLTDNHPPGYYLLMLPWSQLAGSSLAALRLPSALLGAFTVFLLLIAAWRHEGRAVAAFAATWLAFHGSHVMWSRSARMWTLCAAMALISVWALLELRRGYRFFWAAVYLASLVVGLWSEYTFWPVLAAQIVFEAAARARSGALPRTITLQCLAIVLASPIFIFLLSRLGSSSYLEAPMTGHLRYFLSFNAWFEPGSLHHAGVWRPVLSAALVVTGALLIVLGVKRGPQGRRDALAEQPSPPWMEWAVWLSVLWPAGLIWLWRHQPTDEAYPVRSGTLAVAVLVAAVHSLAMRHWSAIQRVLAGALNRRRFSWILDDAALVHSMLPFGILLAASTVLPALASRSILDLAPFVLILASRGLVSVARPIPRGLCLALVIIGGVTSSRWSLIDPPGRDYKGLATAIDNFREPADLLFIEDAWFAQPLHYYLPPAVISSVNAESPQQDDLAAAGRVWVVGYGANPHERVKELARALQGFREVRFVGAAGAGAGLFVRTN